MIPVGMGEDERIHAPYVLAQHLLTEIRTGINNKTLPGYFYPDR